MAFVDYSYYIEVYKGASLSENEFPMLAERASDYVTYITYGRATEDSESVKRAICALAESYKVIFKAQMAASSDSGEIASQTVGSYSVTYRSSADLAEAQRRELYKVAQMYLGSTGLLYRGRCGFCTHHIL